MKSLLSSIGALFFLSACSVAQVPHQGAGMSIGYDGKPIVHPHLSHPKWNELEKDLTSNLTENLGVEINEVRDGSLRILLPTAMLNRKNKTLNPDILPVLRQISKELNTHQSLRVKIVGHTTLDKEDIKNQIYSLRFASLVGTELIQDGVLSSRILIEGRGSMDPLVALDSPNNELFNRRVEIYLYQLR